MSFGAVPVGTAQAKTVTLHNPGLSSVTLSGMQAADPAFKIDVRPDADDDSGGRNGNSQGDICSDRGEEL